MAKRSDLTLVNDEADGTRNAGIEKYAGDGVSGDGDDLDLASDDASAQTEQIRSRIEETRAELGETIDAIQDRLSFANVSEQVSDQVNRAIASASDTVYEATIGKAVNFMKNTGKEISQSSIVNTVRDNPLPFILIGAGAGLLAFQGLGKGGTSEGHRANVPTAHDEGHSASIAQAAGEGLQSVRNSVSNAAGTAAHSVKAAAGSAVETAKATAETAANKATDIAHRAYLKAGDLGVKAEETYRQILQEKPWAIGAAALVAGAAIGMAIPSSKYEGELMGEARINLLTKVQDTATEFVDNAKQAAADVGQNAINEAKSLADDTLG